MSKLYILWALLGVSLIFWDLYRKNSYKLIFASSFLFCAIIAYKYPAKFLYQMVGLVICFILSYVLIKKILNNEIAEYKKLNKLTNCEGKIGVVVKDIAKTISIDGIGFIRYNNELYRAKSIDDKEIKSGRKVKIISREDMILNVEAVD